MRLTVTGWDRNHGEKEILEVDLATPRAMQRIVGDDSSLPTAMISHVAPTILNGNYLWRLELQPKETARLFYLTHSGMSLNELVEMFAAFELEQEQERKEKKAARKAAVEASEIKRRKVS